MAQSSESSTLLDISAIGNLENARVAIVATEWNEKIVTEQLAGAKRIADQAGAVISQVIYVPGSFEIPFACKAVWENKDNLSDAPEAIIAFGAVIRGGTPHFEYVCKAVTEGVLQLNLMLPVPVIFGVLTLDTDEQAWERLGGSHGHKGEEAMITALKMIAMKHKL
jgi:6,7-dimethyl-8-ribityllumazine synthase